MMRAVFSMQRLSPGSQRDEAGYGVLSEDAFTVNPGVMNDADAVPTLLNNALLPA
jgi:hypothetical protein